MHCNAKCYDACNICLDQPDFFFFKLQEQDQNYESAP